MAHTSDTLPMMAAASNGDPAYDRQDRRERLFDAVSRNGEVRRRDGRAADADRRTIRRGERFALRAALARGEC